MDANYNAHMVLFQHGWTRPCSHPWTGQSLLLPLRRSFFRGEGGFESRIDVKDVRYTQEDQPQTGECQSYENKSTPLYRPKQPS
jgi:hypothetical protein